MDLCKQVVIHGRARLVGGMMLQFNIRADRAQPYFKFQLITSQMIKTTQKFLARCARKIQNLILLQKVI